MQIIYSSTVNRDDWRYVLEHSALANTFHTLEYFDIQASDLLGHELLYSCCYIDDEPAAIIAGVRNAAGYHQGLIEIGTKSGGYPLLIDTYDQQPDSERLKNQFIEHFARTYFQGERFIFYPSFNLEQCILDQATWQCTKQYDATAFLDLCQDEDALLMGMGGKCRNAVRYAQRKGVTARIANDVQYFDKFYECYKATRIKKQTQYIGYEELQAKFEAFTRQGLADLWVAFSEDIPLAYVFLWKYKHTINFVYGSSDEQSWLCKANNLIQWELMRFYRNQGYELYNMWGVRNMNFDGNTTPISQREIEGYGKFKLSFGAELRDLVRYVRV
ncbi:hypothetical protein CSA56_08520 [candidate division KSB3 bacterium]|uniref:BioF2-like acetyltransferase domain-containing protein n=1 Tax=candidate division KSB3 bacterium TaxID=2044937 RepID=A0A2G6KGP0_9BACT|nr:MAG: hypothetical protein CSA56_08520 [candidate division KSB3 bacterium]